MNQAAPPPGHRTPTPPPPLRGFRIGVTAHRRAGDLIEALERRGATVLHAPALKIAPVEDDAVLQAETAAVIAAAPEIVMVTTAYGMRRWAEAADAAPVKALPRYEPALAMFCPREVNSLKLINGMDIISQPAIPPVVELVSINRFILLSVGPAGPSPLREICVPQLTMKLNIANITGHSIKLPRMLR